MWGSWSAYKGELKMVHAMPFEYNLQSKYHHNEPLLPQPAAESCKAMAVAGAECNTVIELKPEHHAA